MKKILLTLVLLISLKLAANCQSQLGIIGGVNIAKVHTDEYLKIMNGSPLTSFHVGLVTNFRLSFNLYFQPQFLLSGKGTKDFRSYLNTASINVFYFEIPLNFLYKTGVGKGNLLVGLGPYIGKSLFGKVKSEDSNRNISSVNKINDDVTNFDMGLNLIAGYEFKSGPLVDLNYSLGASNAIGGERFLQFGRNRYFGISVGYFLR